MAFTGNINTRNTWH